MPSGDDVDTVERAKCVAHGGKVQSDQPGAPVPSSVPTDADCRCMARYHRVGPARREQVARKPIGQIIGTGFGSTGARGQFQRCTRGFSTVFAVTPHSSRRVVCFKGSASCDGFADDTSNHDNAIIWRRR
jgi:hypothetical protein